MNPKSKTPKNKKTVDLVSERMSTLMDDINKFQENLDHLTAENNDLKDRVNTLTVDYAYAKNQILKYDEEFKSILSQLENKTTALLAALSKLDSANESIDKLNSIIQHEEWKQNRSVETAEKEQKRIQDNCNHLNDIVKTQAETIKTTSQKLMEAKTNEDHLARKTIELYNTNQKLSNEITDLKNQIENLTKSPPANSKEELENKLEEYRNFYNNIKHSIIHISSTTNPIKKINKFFTFYKNLYKHFKSN